MKLSELIRDLEYTCTRPIPDAEITYVCHDSRKAGPDAMFVCVCGYVSDGHNYALSAYSNGARVFVAQKPISLPSDALVLYVQDSRV